MLGPILSIIIISTLLPSCRHASAPGTESKIKISGIKQTDYKGDYTDAHMHLAGGYHDETPFAENHRLQMDEIYRTEFEQLNRLRRVKGGLILTPTYRDEWSHLSLEKRLAENQEIIASASRHLKSEGRSFGFMCGVDVTSPDAVEFAASCLKIPGIRGIKLRFGDRAKLWPIFEELVGIAAQHRAVLLTHFPSATQSRTSRAGESSFPQLSRGVPKEVAKVMEVMARHPEAILIIAHSGTSSVMGLDGLATIGKEYSKISKTKNIYTEISFAFKQTDVFKTTDPNVETIVDSWRAFGWDRVLFGTDAYTRRDGNPFLLEFLGADSVFPTEIKSITAKEAQALLQTNFERFAKDHL